MAARITKAITELSDTELDRIHADVLRGKCAAFTAEQVHAEKDRRRVRKEECRVLAAAEADELAKADEQARQMALQTKMDAAIRGNSEVERLSKEMLTALAVAKTKFHALREAGTENDRLMGEALGRPADGDPRINVVYGAVWEYLTFHDMTRGGLKRAQEPDILAAVQGSLNNLQGQLRRHAGVHGLKFPD
jgi:hypothetical protein